MGGAIGTGRVEVGSLSSPSSAIPVVPKLGEFKENHSAFKAMIGIRPIALVGAELAYVDFGHPSGTVDTGVANASASADVKLRGPAAFAVLYLPVPVVDVFVKAGLARLKSDASATVMLSGPLCVNTLVICQYSAGSSENNTGFAAGAGAQVKLGPAAVRGEFERFNVKGGHPDLFSLGVIWAF